MTRSDIEHLVQVTHSLRSKLDETEFDQFMDRMLWAIHASHGNPHFDENHLRRAARGEDGLRVFPE